MKRCPRCRIFKPPSQFTPDISKASGFKSWCKDCDNAKCRAYYEANKAGRAQYYRENAARVRARNKATRDQAIAIYGGICSECGDSSDRLEFDHPDWDGGEHRKIEHHLMMLRRIVKAGRPIEDRRLRLLCGPCHRRLTPYMGQLNQFIEHRLTAQAVRRAQVLRLRSAGWTRDRIAAELGAGRRTVQRDLVALRREGTELPDRCGIFSKALIAGAALAVLALAGCGGASAARHHSVVPVATQGAATGNVLVCQHYRTQRAWSLKAKANLYKTTVAQDLQEIATFMVWLNADQQQAQIGTPLYQDLGGLIYVEQNGDTAGHTILSASAQVMADCEALGVRF